MSECKMGIYTITNNITNKLYVGSSVNINKRWKTHVSQLRNNNHPNVYLQNSWKKYGELNFSFKIVENVFDENKLLLKEQYWIDSLNATDRIKGYNIYLIAGSPMKGRKHTKSTLIKLGINSKKWHKENKGTTSYNLYLSNLSNALQGHEVSQETRNKISKANRGKYFGENNPFYGKNHDHDARTKMSISKSKLSVEQIKEVKILLSEGEKAQHISEVFNTQHTNILSIKNHGRYDYIIPETDFNVTYKTRRKLTNHKRTIELNNNNLTGAQVLKIKRLIFEGYKLKHIAKIFNTYDSKIRDIKCNRLFTWVERFEQVDIDDELFKIDILNVNRYFKKGKLKMKDLILVFKLHNEGIECSDISVKFNVHTQTISNILNNNSIKNIIEYLKDNNFDTTYERLLCDELLEYNKLNKENK